MVMMLTEEIQPLFSQLGQMQIIFLLMPRSLVLQSWTNQAVKVHKRTTQAMHVATVAVAKIPHLVVTSVPALLMHKATHTF
jgi:hypothetical protein